MVERIIPYFLTSLKSVASNIFLPIEYAQILLQIFIYKIYLHVLSSPNQYKSYPLF